MTEIERINRLTEWLEISETRVGNVIIDFFETWMENLQIAEGSVIMRVDSWMREQVKKINRKSKKIEKEYDLLMGLNEGMDNPLEIPEIDPPLDPSDPQDPQCVSGTIRTDPVTCMRWRCNPDGTEQFFGYDQDCLDAKNPQPPLDPDPPGDPVDPNDPVLDPCYQMFVGQDTTNWPKALVGASICGTIDTWTLFNANNALLDFGNLFLNPKRAIDVIPSLSIAQPTEHPEMGDSFFIKGQPCIVTIPYQRNSYFATSIYTDQGENHLRERFNTGWIEKLDYSKTYEEYMAALTSPYNQKPIEDMFALFELPEYGETEIPPVGV